MVWPAIHHGYLRSHKFKGSDALTQVRVSDLYQCEKPSTLVEFPAEEPSWFFFFFQCSRLNYYSQREPFISSDTAGSFLGKQLYCCVRLTQTVVICNKDKKIALVS